MKSNLVLSSPSEGKLFISTFAALERSEVPNLLLPDSYPFAKLWYNHLMSLSRPGRSFNNVVNALLSIALGNPLWMEGASADEIVSLQTEMRHLLATTPPNVIVVSGLDDSNIYGLHFPESGLWPFIGISSKYVELWMAEEEGSDGKLGLTALLLASLNHEIAHWIQTLRSGYPKDQKKRTLKFINPPWRPWIGEAGNYVEFATQGGIMEYSAKGNRAILVVGRDRLANYHRLPSCYLKAFLSGATMPLLFKPGSELGPSNPDATFDYLRGTNFFPFEDIDGCGYTLKDPTCPEGLLV